MTDIDDLLKCALDLAMEQRAVEKHEKDRREAVDGYAHSDDYLLANAQVASYCDTMQEILINLRRNATNAIVCYKVPLLKDPA